MIGIVSAAYHTATVNEVKAEVEILSEKLKRHKEALEQMTNARDFWQAEAVILVRQKNKLNNMLEQSEKTVALVMNHMRGVK